MKRLFFSALFIALLISVSIETTAQNTEEEAIKKTLLQESNSYFNKDYDGWANTWSHDSASYVIREDMSGKSELVGWNAISNEYKQSIKNVTVNDASVASLPDKKNFYFYINGNVATVSFKQGGVLTNFETRTLIKQDGAWKILNFTLIDNSSYAMQDIMNTLKSVMGKNWMAK